MKRYSHTIVRDGQPFIEQVLRNVEPFMDRMLVTVSVKSKDGTREVLSNLQSEWKGKLVVDTENVKSSALLTQVRQKQVDKTPMGAWILFLDADDWWPREQLKLTEMFLTNDVDGLAVNPFQIINEYNHDSTWHNKWFTKWFRKQAGVHYERPWPRDLIFKGDEILYWKRNEKVPRIPIKFFHLSNLMKWRFRNEKWAKEFKSEVGKPEKFEPGWEEEIKKIYDIYYSPT